MTFSKPLIQWYLINKRDLPWRLTTDTYTVWLSEIMLQQTTVKQGMPYFNNFIRTFPTLKKLANATEEQVLKQWQGLGYYSRARNLFTTAKYVYNELNGSFPNNYKDLLKLKGIGPYTAAAIASICYNEPVAVLDGNVFRVLARYFNINTPINSPKGLKEFQTLAQKLIDDNNPANYNQGIMELGALICKPNNPNCINCPINKGCLARKNKSINTLPIKIKKIKIKKRYFNYLFIITNDGKTVLTKRSQKGIWHNLYEFPLIETSKTFEANDLILHNNFESLFKDINSLDLSCYNSKEIVHKLTHQHIYTKFWIVKMPQHPLAKLPLNEMSKFPVSTLIHNFIEGYLLH